MRSSRISRGSVSVFLCRDQSLSHLVFNPKKFLRRCLLPARHRRRIFAVLLLSGLCFGVLFLFNLVHRFNSSKIELTFYWRIHCDDMGLAHQSATLVPNIWDSNLSKSVAQMNVVFRSLSQRFSQEEHCHVNEARRDIRKTGQTVGASCAILDVLSRC